MNTKQFIFCLLVIMIYPTISQSSTIEKQLLQLTTLINSTNVNTPVRNIPGFIIYPDIYKDMKPLDYAISYARLRQSDPKKYDKIIDHLIDYGAHIVDDNAFLLAIAANEPSLVKKLIDHGAIVRQNTFTHFLKGAQIFRLKPRMIELLIQHGADVNATCKAEEHTALCRNFELNIIQCLLDHGANTVTNCRCFLNCIEKKEPEYQSIKNIFNALQDSANTNQSANLDHDAQCLKKAYELFLQGNHEPLHQMLIVTPWVLSKLTSDFAIDQMTIACQKVFKKESIIPLIRYLALAPADTKTMCSYHQLLQKYKVALGESKTQKTSCCTIS